MAGIRLCRSGIDRIDYAEVKIDKVDALRHQRVAHWATVPQVHWCFSWHKIYIDDSAVLNWCDREVCESPVAFRILWIVIKIGFQQ